MKIRLFAPLLTLAATLSAAASPRPPAVDPATLIRLSASVLKVEAMNAEGGYSLGSGVVVGPDSVVTNCHVTRGARQIAVLQAGLRRLALPLQVDARHDLCLLRVRGLEGATVAQIGQSGLLAVGQPVTAIGHTAGMLQSSVGEVLALHRMDGGRVVQSSNFFNSGASGGGLFDADARLVGILTFRLRGGAAHYFAVPTEWLARNLQDAQLAERTPTASALSPAAPAALAFWEEPQARQPWFLQAAVLERDANWRALQPLAQDWARHDASDPEPWYLLGLSLERQDRPGEAAQALACSLAIAPEFESARAELKRLNERAPTVDSPGPSDPTLRLAAADPSPATAPCHL